MTLEEEHEPQFDTLPLETEQHESPAKTPDNLRDDPKFAEIKAKLFAKFKERTGLPILAANGSIALGRENDAYFDYVTGPNVPNESIQTLDGDAEAAFRSEYPEAANAYDEKERTRVYADVQSDPAYKELDRQVLESTNKDHNLRQASRTGKSPWGSSWSETWDSLYSSNHHHALFQFVSQYPEKAAGYAEQWYDYVEEHPDMKDRYGLELGKFSLPQKIASALEHMQTIRKNEQAKIALREKQLAEFQMERIRQQHEIPAPARAYNESILESPEQAALDKSTLERIQAGIRNSVSPELRTADRPSLEKLQDRLSELPFVGIQDTAPILEFKGKPEGVAVVPTEIIVGSVSGDFQSWSSKHEGQAKRVVDVAQSLLKAEETSIESVFRIKNPKEGEIKLKKIEGPRGPLFFVVEGTDRVAGSKLAQIPEIPAQVENITEMSEIRTPDGQLATHWQRLIEGGFISGRVEQTEDQKGTKTYELKINKQILPWIGLDQGASIKMTKIYLERYPHGLDGIKSLKTGEPIPKEAFIDPIAMNFFLAGRWSEYKPRKQSDIVEDSAKPNK